MITKESYLEAKKTVDTYEREQLNKHIFSDSLPKSRCCGRCDGVNDICVGDIICEEHNTMGCEVCYGARQ